MKVALLVTVAMLVLTACGESAVAEYEHRIDWREHFDEQETDGTFVLERIGSDEPALVYNIARARKSLPPADTYKILASLVFLETGVVTSLDQEIIWDGEGSGPTTGAPPISLTIALDRPVDWIYEQLGDEVGPDRLAVWVARSSYGNEHTRTLTGPIWRDGTLMLTPFDQAAFMGSLFGDDHPFDRYAALDVMELMPEVSGDGWTMRYQTATTYTSDAVVGWLIGSVSTDDGDWAFAMNADLEKGEYLDITRRMELTRSVLTAAGILPESG